MAVEPKRCIVGIRIEILFFDTTFVILDGIYCLFELLEIYPLEAVVVLGRWGPSDEKAMPGVR